MSRWAGLIPVEWALPRDARLVRVHADEFEKDEAARRERRRQYDRDRYSRRRRKRLKQAAQYRRRNRKKCRARTRAWRAANLEHDRRRNRERGRQMRADLR